MSIEPDPISGGLASPDDAPMTAQPTGPPVPETGDERLLRELLEVPEDLPVQCLGLNGNIFYYLDGLGQFRALEAAEHGRSNVFALFGRHEEYLLRLWGRKNKKGAPTGGLHTDEVSNVLMKGCGKAGLMDPARQVRGVGGWANPAGGLVMHLGDRVWINGTYQPPGRYGEHVYPAMPATMRPHIDPQNLDAGWEMLAKLKTWHWQNDLQALLVLGFIGQGFVAGALRWRTHMACDGEAGSGKSALQELLVGTYGSWLLQTSDTTAAALYQLMSGRGQPVAIDEFEAGDNPVRKHAVVQVLRQASSGGAVQRGGDNHIGRTFSVNFPAFLTSIVTISLQPQDESRTARGVLLKLPEGAVPPDLTPKRLAAIGTRLMRRMIDQWPRFKATFAAYRAALDSVGKFNARQQDTYGTLLACAGLLLEDDTPTVEEARAQAKKLVVMVGPARLEALADQDRCLNHLLTSTVDRGAGEKRAVSSWIKQTQALDEYANPAADLRATARRALAAFGLKVEEKPEEQDEPGGALWLFVSNTHQQLAKAFDNTPWPGGAGASGSWVGVLRRIPEAYAPKNPMHLAGALARGTMLPLKGFIDWSAE